MNKIIAIVATDPEGLIGINNKMPWHVPEDLKNFKALTLNNTVIMGRKTWESLGCHSLSNRINYVVSTKESFNLIEGTNAICFTSIDAAISESCLRFPKQNIFIIGGGSIFEQTLPIWDELYLTIINKDNIKYSKGDRVYFLKDNPNFIRTYFTEVNHFVTQNATYKKYIRKITNPKTTNKLF